MGSEEGKALGSEEGKVLGSEEGKAMGSEEGKAMRSEFCYEQMKKFRRGFYCTRYEFRC
jgi:hypothetical protein